MFFNLNKSEETGSFESYEDIKNKEYKDLLAGYNALHATLNLVDSASERFDAICLELKAMNHRIAAVRKELLEI